MSRSSRRQLPGGLKRSETGYVGLDVWPPEARSGDVNDVKNEVNHFVSIAVKFKTELAQYDCAFSQLQLIGAVVVILEEFNPVEPSVVSV